MYFSRTTLNVQLLRKNLDLKIAFYFTLAYQSSIKTKIAHNYNKQKSQVTSKFKCPGIKDSCFIPSQTRLFIILNFKYRKLNVFSNSIIVSISIFANIFQGIEKQMHGHEKMGYTQIRDASVISKYRQLRTPQQSVCVKR